MSVSAAPTALALMQGGLVALPRADALGTLRRLRSPAWAATLPGSILLGTFLPLAAPQLATALVVLAAIATLPLAAVAALAVVRGPRAAPLALAIAAAVASAVAGGWGGQLAATVLTALACLALGAALARLIPARTVLAAVVFMCLLDIALLACGSGQGAAALIANAARHMRGGAFTHARVGTLTLDYPDLVLAAVLGGFLAGQSGQRRAAALVATLAAFCFALQPAGSMWPATVPIALTLGVLRAAGLPRPRQTGVLATVTGR